MVICVVKQKYLSQHNSLKNWKNQKLSERSQSIEKLNRSHCFALYISKNCEQQQMTGTSDFFKSIQEPEIE